MLSSSSRALPASAAWKASTASPLLNELVRALRARRHYGDSAPVVQPILDRMSAVWTTSLQRLPDLSLSVTEDGFALASGERIRGAASAMLARELARTGIRQIKFEPGLRPEELGRLVDILVVATGARAGQTDYDRAFERSGIENISLAFERRQGEQEKPPAARSGAPAPRRESRRRSSEPIGALLQELSGVSSAAELQRVFDRLYGLLDPRMASGDYVDAYAAALELRRLQASSRLPESVRTNAGDALQALVLRDPELVQIPLERVYGRHSEAGIEALQLLAALGPRLVPHLLAAHERGAVESRQYTAAILLTMGDAAFPALLEQLESSDVDRAVLTAELLGKMGNPRAVSALSLALSARRPLAVRLAAVWAIARLGGERSRLVLEARVQSPSDEIAGAVREALEQL